jgi:hypothetical protein
MAGYIFCMTDILSKVMLICGNTTHRTSLKEKFQYSTNQKKEVSNPLKYFAEDVCICLFMYSILQLNENIWLISLKVTLIYSLLHN